jgi:hypothetical protein
VFNSPVTTPVRQSPQTTLVRQLQELVAALDRRMPQVMRAGESAIARDAATLRQRALRRIDELSAEAE